MMMLICILFIHSIIAFILFFSSSSSSFAGYDTAIGYLDVKTSSGVSFYVQRNSSYSSIKTVIPYEVPQLNIGNAMNLETGVFTAPVDGRFHFSFTALSSSSSGPNYVYLRLNGAVNAISYAAPPNYHLPMMDTLQLKKGDTVDVFLFDGSILDSGNHYTQFSGFLLEEDLVL